jgi:HAD superfamily hydrolase (TIGR01509 family)
MISLVIFDCDGVLVDSEPMSNRALAEALTEIGLPYTQEASMRDFMGRAWEDSLGDIERKLGAPVPEGFTDSFRARRDAAFRDAIEPIPGIRDAIEAIDAERCVASSGLHEKIRLTLGLTELLDLFEERIFSASEVENGKPAPDLFLHAAQTMGHEPEHCAVVEDATVGIRAAHAAGMVAIGFVDNTPREALEAAGAHATFSDMRELPGLIEKSGEAPNLT